MAHRQSDDPVYINWESEIAGKYDRSRNDRKQQFLVNRGYVDTDTYTATVCFTYLALFCT